MHVALEGPNWTGAMMALANAFTDKVAFCARHGIEITHADWPCDVAPNRLTAELVRPAEKRPPLAVTLLPTDIGRFAAEVVLPERGNWDLDLVVERGTERFAVTRRMFLK